MIDYILDRIKGKVPIGHKRSHLWPKIRREHLKNYSKCVVCGGEDRLQVHHMTPFHLDPTKELDPNNLITLCESGRGGMNCHLAVGHLGNFRGFNPTVMTDATWWAFKKLSRL